MKQRRLAFFCTVALALIIILALTLGGGKKDDDTMVVSLPSTGLDVPFDEIAEVVQYFATPDPMAGATTVPTAEPIAQPTVQQIQPTVPPVQPTAEPVAVPTAEPVQQYDYSGGLRSAHIRVIGDIMFCEDSDGKGGQLTMAKQADGSYNFMPQFQYIAGSLSNADFTIANLETTLGLYTNSKGNTMKYSGYPMFNSPESVLDALKECGIDFLTLANNHMLDRYFDGMKNTVKVVQSYGFDYVGAYPTEQERRTGAKIVEVNGIKLGFVAYVQTTNTMETACSKDAVNFGVPYLKTADFAGDIQRLKAAGADVVIALPHWGTEYKQNPDDNQTYYAGKLASAGADIILGSHPHMVQPMEYKYFNDAQGNAKEVFAIFCLGNFISDMTVKYTDSGIILDFTIREQADGTFRVEDVGYVPVYVWKQDGQFTVVSSAQYLNQRPNGMNDANYNRMVETYYELQQVLGNSWRVLEK